MKQFTADPTAEFNRTFGRAGYVKFVARDGAYFVIVSGRGGEATVSLQGAQVLSWIAEPYGEMLWCSSLSPAGRGTPIRGGVPICWPWFGPHPTDPGLPQHGVVRTALWDVLKSGDVDGDGFIVLSTAWEGAMLRLRVDVGARLEVRLETRNVGQVPIALTEALHTYFAVGDVGRADVVGLDGCSYRDRTEGDTVKTQVGPLIAAQETNAHFDVTPDDLSLVDRVRGLEIAIHRMGAASTVVWNPGRSAAGMSDVPTGDERGFLCVESGNVGASKVVVEPGTSHRIGVRYTVSQLAL